MTETTTPQHVIKRECSCGKRDDQIDGCQVCLEYRANKLPQQDSYIFAALKLAIMDAFFRQQSYYHNGQYTQYGGQAVDMVKRILESKEFKDATDEIVKMLISRKSEWEEVAIAEMVPYVKRKAQEITQTWDFKDGLYSILNKEALEQARVLFANDPVLAEKVRKAVSSKDYTVKFDVRVEITEKREAQQ